MTDKKKYRQINDALKLAVGLLGCVINNDDEGVAALWKPAKPESRRDAAVVLAGFTGLLLEPFAVSRQMSIPEAISSIAISIATREDD